MSKSRYSANQRQKAVEDYLKGNKTASEIRADLGIASTSTFQEWVNAYREHGVSSFHVQKGNRAYSSEIKMMAVEDYVSKNLSPMQIIAKYDISSRSVLRKWISEYNANRELKDYCPKREVYMAEARRKTTIEERKEIVEYCINHERNYKDTASLYDVSYSQVYSWVKKYDANGEESLIDKRGHHKTDDEVDELERLRRENLRLKRQLEEKDMLTELLKKVKEFERM